MRRRFYSILAILMPAISFSQAIDKDTTKQILDSLCDGSKIFYRCEIPVDFKRGKNAMEDSLNNYLRTNNSELQNGKANFQLIVAKNGKVYDVKKQSGDIAGETDIIKALQTTSDLWTIGLQNSFPICSYVRLEIECADNKINVKMLK
jgi:cytochrome b involved in lipid metabolism